MCSSFAIWLPEPKNLKINVTYQLIIIKLVYTRKIVYKPILYKNKNFCPAKVNFGPLCIFQMSVLLLAHLHLVCLSTHMLPAVTIHHSIQ